ncbi:MAG: radical SAM/SPASM domain-containing protein [Candidatus Muiribacteriota bacterium]
MNIKSDFRDISIICGITEKCNLDCVYCVQHEEIYGETNKISEFKNKEIASLNFHNFKLIYDNLDGYFDSLQLSGVGEPLLNSDFIHIFDYSLDNNDKKFDKFYLFTNATLLDENTCGHIIEIVKKTKQKVCVVFSVGTNSNINYKKLKKKPYFFEVISNIENFIKKIDENNLWDSLFCTVQFIVFEENCKEIPSFINYWECFYKQFKKNWIIEGNAGDELSEETPLGIDIIEAHTLNQKKSCALYLENIKKQKLKNTGKSIENLIHKMSLYLQSNKNRKPCGELWKMPYITSKGLLTVCCRDYYEDGVYGDLKKDKFSSIFYGKNAIKFKLSHITGDFNNPSICRDCNDFMLDSVSDDDVFNFLKQTEYEKYYKIYQNVKNREYKVDFRYIEAENQKVLKTFLNNYQVETLCAYEGKVKDINNELILLFPELKSREIKSENDFEPCMYMFEYIYFKNDGIYTGCERVKLNYKDYEKLKAEVLSGDYSSVPAECFGCRQRKRISIEFAGRNSTLLNKFNQDFTLSEKEIVDNLPDFNKIELTEKFLKTEASTYRLAWERFILKYDKNNDKLEKVAFYLENCKDPYLYSLLIKGFKWNKNYKKAEFFTKKLKSNTR